jgi:flagellar biosynthetic protein FliR
MALLPGFGEASVPMRIRLMLAAGFTAVVFPAVSGEIAASAVLNLGAVLIEAGAGLALGVGFRLFVFALQIAGTIAAQSTSLAQLTGGASPEPLPAMGHLLTMAGIAVAVASGLHLQAARALIVSYEVLPAGRLPEAADLARWGVGGIARAFALALSLAAPFVIAALVYNLALGAINRAMPQLMVAFVGAPAMTFGGLVLLFLVTPGALALWQEALAGFGADPFGAPP